MSTRCRPYIKPRSAAPDPGNGSWKVADLCAAYGWPTSAPGGGVIAIVELGGGWTSADLSAFAAANGLPSIPSVVDVSVDGTTNMPGGDADGEVALDIQVAWASYRAATGKDPEIRVYWAQDIASAVRAAYKDGCDVCSISWGADEAQWPATGTGSSLDMEKAGQEAAAAGMVVLAASGDNDSSDGGPDAADVDCPASCPSIVGCGGTSKTATNETVWNNEPGQTNGSGTGGGYSTIFAMPAWQSANGAPQSGSGTGTGSGSGTGQMARMVPDIAACADPQTGYEIVVGGVAQVVGGTSAVAPLYAGLVAACGKKLAPISSKLWGAGDKVPGAFVDITSGDNGAFHATTGPDPCTGLGAPIGTAIAAAIVPAP